MEQILSVKHFEKPTLAIHYFVFITYNPIKINKYLHFKVIKCEWGGMGLTELTKNLHVSLVSAQRSVWWITTSASDWTPKFLSSSTTRGTSIPKNAGMKQRQIALQSNPVVSFSRINSQMFKLKFEQTSQFFFLFYFLLFSSCFVKVLSCYCLQISWYNPSNTVV